MSKLVAALALLLSPRRSFAYRSLEAENTRLRTERDEYKKLWIDAVEYTRVSRGEPRATVIESRPAAEPPVKRRTRADIEAEHRAEAAERFAQFQASIPSAPDELTN